MMKRPPGRPRFVTEQDANEMYLMHLDGKSTREIARKFRVSRTTAHKYIRDLMARHSLSPEDRIRTIQQRIIQLSSEFAGLQMELERAEEDIARTVSEIRGGLILRIDEAKKAAEHAMQLIKEGRR